MDFSVDDKGNEALFYEQFEYGTWAQGACLDREASPDANDLAWDNWSGGKLEKWAIENGYGNETSEAKRQDFPGGNNFIRRRIR